MKLDPIAYGLTRNTRKLVKAVAKDITNNRQSEKAAAAMYADITKEMTVKVSGNPIKNLFNFWHTYKQVAQKMAEMNKEVIGKIPATINDNTLETLPKTNFIMDLLLKTK